jgi:bacillithiol biosynthesis deacetylase BshB1
MSEEVDLLFVGAHPDDVELACGASVAKYVKSGLRVGVLDLTSGEMGTRGTPQTRKREAQASARIMGAVFRKQLDFGDGNLRTGREEEMQLIDLLRATRPRLVFAPFPDDRHPDHTRAGRVVTEASFYSGLRQIKTSAPAHRPQTVIYYLQNYQFTPSFIVDVTSGWSTKMKAIRAFKSQFFDPKSKEPKTFISNPEFLNAIDARGRHFGILIGATYGEAYITKQPPRIDDVIASYGGREV